MASNDAKSSRWIAIVIALALLLWGARVLISRLAHGHGDSSPTNARDDADAAGDPNRAARRSDAAPNEATRVDASPRDASGIIDHTVRDPFVHERVRAEIFRAWAMHAAQQGTTSPTDGGFPAAPGSLDPTYIRTLIRDEFVPMARVCYEQQVERAREARGRVVMSFEVMGDEHAGGIVDDVQIEAPDGGGFDESFRTCMRETMRTMTFRAPDGGGRITVRYPFVLESGRDE